MDTHKRAIDFIDRGLSFFRNAPLFGSQDVGISPGGPMDRLSVITGNILLGQDDYSESLEILLPPVIKVLKPICFVVTGAHRYAMLRFQGGEVTIPHGEVLYAPPDSEICFFHNTLGFRTVLTWREMASPEEKHDFVGRRRGDFNKVFTFPDNKGFIRILPGPEYDRLASPESFTESPWRIASDSNDMGCRLEGPGLASRTGGAMISDAVSDGTVQLTPRGPIVLLYHRQTVGGYPRIFNIISPDLDRLSQYCPGEYVQFRTVSFEEAEELNRQKAYEIGLFRSRFAES